MTAGIRVFMNSNRRTLPHDTASALLPRYIISMVTTPGSRDTSHSLPNLAANDVTVTTAGNTCVD